MLFVAFLTFPSALSSRSEPSPTKPAVSAAIRFESPIAWSVRFELARASTLARFSPWKARPKIVLAEADHDVRAESDMGPAVVPSGRGSASLIVLHTSRVPALSPLRC